MFRSRCLLLAVLLVVGFTGCYSRSTPIRRGPIDRDFLNDPDFIKKFPSICAGLWCTRTVYLDECDLKDASGSIITELVVDNGDRICFINQSDCEIILKFSTDLFGHSQPYVSLAPEECTNLSVNQGATDDYPLELICKCPGRGDDSTNPTVRIGGDDDEEDDGDDG